jgi:hypothetical protein
MTGFPAAMRRIRPRSSLDADGEEVPIVGGLPSLINHVA